LLTAAQGCLVQLKLCVNLLTNHRGLALPSVVSPLQEDELLGHRLPQGSWLIVHVQGVHQQYEQPAAWRPERYMPGGEYDQFDDAIRPYMVRGLSPWVS
jgi:hypothetical protein